MHIAFVTTESPYGDRGGCGIAAYLRAIIPELADAGHRITVLANANQEKNFVAEEGRVSVQHFRLPSLHWYAAKVPLIRGSAPLPLRQLEWSLAFYRKAARLAVNTKIDVIESTEAGSMLLHRIAPLVIRLHGSERMFREHSGLPVDANVKWNDSLEAYSCKRAAAIIAPSHFQAKAIASRRRWPADRVHVVPNPIGRDLLRAARQFHRNGNTERVVLYTGRLAPVKGIEILLEAAKLVHRRDASILFVLAGPWQMPQSPEHYGLELNRKSAQGICWVGPQDRPQIVEWYQRASVFVMPSYYESFGISAIEAMAFGAPIIATDTSGIAEILRNNPSASLVPKGDPKALADGIIGLLSSTNGHNPRAESSLAAIEQFFPDRIAEQSIRIYEKVHRDASRQAAS